MSAVRLEQFEHTLVGRPRRALERVAHHVRQVVVAHRHRVRVAQRDRGVGISEEDQKQLFKRFGRVESSAHVAGTGLGLWLSREIALMHEGDLTVRSESGAGSTFTFSVPLTN